MPTKTKLRDLQNHLFAQIERLTDDELDDDGVAREVRRTKALVDLSGRVIDAGRLGLAAWETSARYGLAPKVRPLALGNGQEGD